MKMIKKTKIPPVPYFFYTIGVLLLIAGLGVWWNENRAVWALPDPDGQIALAVVATQPRPTRAPSQTPTLTPTLEPTEAVAVSSVTTPTPTATPQPSPTATPDPFPPAITIPSRLVIPKINVDTAVVKMVWETKQDITGNPYSEWMVPDNEAGWHVNSALPGHSNNVVMSGHHNVGAEIFRYLDQLEPGDAVAVYADDHKYEYVIEEKYIVREKGEPFAVREENNQFTLPTDDERLTIISCWPYETNTHRIVIVARPKVQVVPTELPVDDMNAR